MNMLAWRFPIFFFSGPKTVPQLLQKTGPQTAKAHYRPSPLLASFSRANVDPFLASYFGWTVFDGFSQVKHIESRLDGKTHLECTMQCSAAPTFANALLSLYQMVANNWLKQIRSNGMQVYANCQRGSALSDDIMHAIAWSNPPRNFLCAYCERLLSLPP